MLRLPAVAATSAVVFMHDTAAENGGKGNSKKYDDKSADHDRSILREACQPGLPTASTIRIRLEITRIGEAACFLERRLGELQNVSGVQDCRLGSVAPVARRHLDEIMCTCLRAPYDCVLPFAAFRNCSSAFIASLENVRP